MAKAGAPRAGRPGVVAVHNDTWAAEPSGDGRVIIPAIVSARHDSTFSQLLPAFSVWWWVAGRGGGWAPLLALWLLLAAAWGRHGWIVPRIGDYRPLLEAASRARPGGPVHCPIIGAQ